MTKTLGLSLAGVSLVAMLTASSGCDSNKQIKQYETTIPGPVTVEVIKDVKRTRDDRHRINVYDSNGGLRLSIYKDYFSDNDILIDTAGVMTTGNDPRFDKK